MTNNAPSDPGGKLLELLSLLAERVRKLEEEVRTIRDEAHRFSNRVQKFILTGPQQDKKE